MAKPSDALSLPIIGDLIGTIGGLSAQLLFPQASSWSTHSQQKEAARTPLALPPPDALINAWMKGYFTKDVQGNAIGGGTATFIELMRRHGIFVGAGEVGACRR